MRCILLQILLLSFSINVHSQDQLTNAGNIQIHPGVSVTFFGTLTNNGSLTTGPTVTFNADLILSAGSTFTAGASNHNIAGNWTNNGGTFTPGLSTVVFNGTGAQSINGTAASQTFNNVVVSKSTGTLLSVSGNTTTLATNNFTETSGNFTAPATMNIIVTATSSLILTAGIFTAGTTTNITGNWTNNGGTFTPGLNTVVFNGSGAQAINGTATSQAFYNLAIIKTAGTMLGTDGGTATLTTNGFTQTTGNFTAPATLNINGSLLLTAGTFIAGTTTNIKGNWIRNGGTFTAGTKTVVFNGTGTNTLGGSSITSFYNLTINTGALTDIVQLTNNATVSSILRLTRGVLDLNSKSLSVTSGLNTAIARTSGYILSEKTDNSSKIIWSIGSNLTSHTYPFGTASGSYIPFVLNLTAGNIGNVTLSTYPTASDNTPYPSSPEVVTNMQGLVLSDNSLNTVDRFWQIVKDGATGTATLTFTATAAEVGAILTPTAQRYESSVNKWQEPLPGQTNTATSATVPGVTTFSPWTMSSSNALLPIELLNFTATLNDTHVDLDWTTVSELNNDYFTVEKTLDLVNYETVAIKDGAGNSIQTLNYFDMDPNPYSGTSYYRLKQTDFDGSVSYSNIVPIELTGVIVFGVNIFPNPAIDNLNISIAGAGGKEVSVIIVDILGRECYSKIMMDESNNYTLNLDLHSRFAAGEYLVALSCGNMYRTQKLIVQ